MPADAVRFTLPPWQKVVLPLGVMVGVPAVEIVIAKVFEVAGPQFGIGVVNAGKSIFQLLMVPTSAAP